MKVKLSNKKEYDIVNDAVILPAAGFGRNKMELYFAPNSITQKEFDTLVKDNTAFEKVVLFAGENETSYLSYQNFVSFGQKLFSVADNATGETVSEMCYNIELEQYTPIERQLIALGLKV